MKVASFIISLIAISVTVWNFIWEHFYIKEKILLTVSDALIESNNLKSFCYIQTPVIKLILLQTLLFS